MVSAVAIVLIVLPSYLIYSTYTSLQRNIKAAKLSGLPYVVTRKHLPPEVAALLIGLTCDL